MNDQVKVTVKFNIQTSEVWGLLKCAETSEYYAHKAINTHQLVDHCLLFLPKHHEHSHMKQYCQQATGYGEEQEAEFKCLVYYDCSVLNINNTLAKVFPG